MGWGLTFCLYWDDSRSLNKDAAKQSLLSKLANKLLFMNDEPLKLLQTADQAKMVTNDLKYSHRAQGEMVKEKRSPSLELQCFFGSETFFRSSTDRKDCRDDVCPGHISVQYLILSGALIHGRSVDLACFLVLTKLQDFLNSPKLYRDISLFSNIDHCFIGDFCRQVIINSIVDSLLLGRPGCLTAPLTSTVMISGAWAKVIRVLSSLEPWCTFLAVELEA